MVAEVSLFQVAEVPTNVRLSNPRIHLEIKKNSRNKWRRSASKIVKQTKPLSTFQNVRMLLKRVSLYLYKDRVPYFH